MKNWLKERRQELKDLWMSSNGTVFGKENGRERTRKRWQWFLKSVDAVVNEILGHCLVGVRKGTGGWG